MHARLTLEIDLTHSKKVTVHNINKQYNIQTVNFVYGQGIPSNREPYSAGDCHAHGVMDVHFTDVGS